MAWSNALKLVKVGGYFVGVVVHGYWRHGIHVLTVAITTIKKNGFELLDYIVAKKAGHK